jgi:2-haloacid dehalogenase
MNALDDKTAGGAVLTSSLGFGFADRRRPVPDVADGSPPMLTQTALRSTNWQRRCERWGCLMAAAQAGERQAYEQLLRELDGWLRRYYARRLPPAAAEDARQDALLAVHARRNAYSPARPFGPWVAAIARYKWIDQVRDVSRSAALSLDDDIPVENCVGEPAMATMAVDDLLRQLKPAQARVIRLVKLEGASIEDASSATGQSAALVKVNIHRGLKKLAALAAGVAVAPARTAATPREDLQTRPKQTGVETMAALPLIVFDVNETLLDLGTMEPTFRRIFGEKGAMRLWFADLILYSAALTVAGCYVPFTDIGAAVMKMLADTRGIKIGDKDKTELTEKFSTMPPYPEVPAALRKLRNAGFRLFTLTDNLLDVQTRQLEHGGIVDLFERRFSADGVKHHKPSREAYGYVERELGARPAELCLIACHTWDTLGAVAAGWEAALIKRVGNDVLGVGPQPHFVGNDLNDVADQIIARYKRAA